MTDQLERVRSLLRKVTYKPGWKITAENFNATTQKYDPATILLILECFMPNLEGRSEPTRLIMHKHLHIWDIERIDDGQIIKFFISGIIREMELHEMDEWFKFDGIHVKDPHP